MVVDDETGPRESLRLILEPEFRVSAVDRGEAAIEWVARVVDERFDVVTLDLRMPGIGGVATLAHLRELDPTLEVIVITGFGSFENAAEAVRDRAFELLGKPFEAGRVLETVRRATAHRRHEQSAARISSLVDGVLRLVDELSREAPRGDDDRLDRLRHMALELRSEVERRTEVTPDSGKGS